jgi:hypothetical protein
MLISMPTGISTICGAFQDILELLCDVSAKPPLAEWIGRDRRRC